MAAGSLTVKRVIGGSVRGASSPAGLFMGLRLEVGIFAAVIALLNFHLIPGLRGRFNELWTFLPGRVLEGEWWRIVAHAFVHVSWYHLLLDAGAFFFLYAGLSSRRTRDRLAAVLFAGAGSLLASIAAAPEVATIGLCGLSGTAHGLMAACGIDLARSSPRGSRGRLLGCAYLLAVAAKSLFEILHGRCLFEPLAFGQLGSPIVACHAGGVLGVLAMESWRWGRVR
ncbi:MAG TPA: rhombosortase [Planctomycetota bacterium]|nr:rhombosortase [Planctomycetota bacterium]